MTYHFGISVWKCGDDYAVAISEKSPDCDEKQVFSDRGQATEKAAIACGRSVAAKYLSDELSREAEVEARET